MDNLDRLDPVDRQILKQKRMPSVRIAWGCKSCLAAIVVILVMCIGSKYIYDALDTRIAGLRNPQPTITPTMRVITLPTSPIPIITPQPGHTVGRPPTPAPCAPG